MVYARTKILRVHYQQLVKLLVMAMDVIRKHHLDIYPLWVHLEYVYQPPIPAFNDKPQRVSSSNPFRLSSMISSISSSSTS